MGKKSLYILLTAVFVASVPIGLATIPYLIFPGLNPFIGLLVSVSFIALIVLGIRWWWRRWAGFTPADWFLVGSMSWLLWSVSIGVWLAGSTLDIQIHDTMFVIAHAHFELAVTIFFGVMTLIYYSFPRITHRRLQPTLGSIHFWVSFLGSWLGFCAIPGVQFYIYRPRRYLDFGNGFNAYQNFENAFTWIGFAILAAQLLFVINLVYSGVRGRKSPDGGGR
jgi:cytochrome c oxidase subunit 1